MPEEDRRNWRRAHKLMGYSLNEYLLKLIMPFAAMGIIAIIISILFSDLLGPTKYLLYIMGGFFPIIGIFYPKIWADNRKREIEQNIHLFITHAGVLATADISRLEIFRSLAEQEDKYGALAEEIGKIVELVDTWNRSLEVACHYVAERTPSGILADFLDRLGRTATAGEDVRNFLLDEQEVVISDYESMYEDSLTRLEDFRDLFLSMIIAIVFIIIFSLIVPFLTGVNPLLLVGASAAVFAVAETGFIIATKITIPEDPIWAKTERVTEQFDYLGRTQIISTIIFIGLTVFIAGQIFFEIIPALSLPLSFYLAIPLTTLAIPGLLTWQEESRIKRRDKNYPGFIRTLSTSASARDANTVNVLETLKDKDFGDLTTNIQNLYKRLRMRAEEKLAWDFFSADTGSHLISRFNDMYFEGTSEGGEPKTMGDIVTENFKRITRLRERRERFADGLTGVIYTITIAAFAAIFIGYKFGEEMIRMILSLIEGAEMPAAFHAGVYDLPAINFVLIVVILLNALLTSYYMTSIRGSSKVSSYTHVVFLAWIGIIVAFLIKNILGEFLII